MGKKSYWSSKTLVDLSDPFFLRKYLTAFA